VRVDSRQKKIPIVRWRTDYDRPIFLIELRSRKDTKLGHEGPITAKQLSFHRELFGRVPDEILVGTYGHSGSGLIVSRPHPYPLR
jgi:hypothetical protein